MQFIYQYRTTDNKIHCGKVSAANREAAFSKLRSKGVRPAKLEEAPGFFNKLFGKGKRWIAIAVLAVISCSLSFSYLRLRSSGLLDASYEISPRTQVYGDASFLQLCNARGWSNVFSNATDRLLAKYAVPGVSVAQAETEVPDMGAFAADIKVMLEASRDDPSEVRKMKSIVNGMKREAETYIKNGGSPRTYIERLSERQRTEVVILKNAIDEIEQLSKKWKGAQDKAALIERWNIKNEYLREMGFETIPLPLDWEKADGAGQIGD